MGWLIKFCLDDHLAEDMVKKYGHAAGISSDDKEVDQG